ncbi:MAG: hypothetical protein ACQERN_10395 [Thermodesulfobacteriota bacterium]
MIAKTASNKKPAIPGRSWLPGGWAKGTFSLKSLLPAGFFAPLKFLKLGLTPSDNEKFLRGAKSPAFRQNPLISLESPFYPPSGRETLSRFEGNKKKLGNSKYCSLKTS